MLRSQSIVFVVGLVSAVLFAVAAVGSVALLAKAGLSSLQLRFAIYAVIIGAIALIMEVFFALGRRFPSQQFASLTEPQQKRRIRSARVMVYGGVAGGLALYGLLQATR